LAADEHVDLAHVGAVLALGGGLHQVHDHEERVAVLLHLGALVAVVGVLDRQRVQAELHLHVVELFVGRIAQRHPHEAPRPGDVFADVVHSNVGELGAVFVGHAVDQHRDYHAVRRRHQAGMSVGLRRQAPGGGQRGLDGLRLAREQGQALLGEGGVARHVGPQAASGFGAGERREADAPLRQFDEALLAQRVRPVPGAADEHALAALDARLQLGEERQLGGQPAREAGVQRGVEGRGRGVRLGVVAQVPSW
jgi:hypothetical protein